MESNLISCAFVFALFFLISLNFFLTRSSSSYLGHGGCISDDVTTFAGTYFSMHVI